MLKLHVTHKGETKTVREWAKEKNIKQEVVSQRLSTGWSVNKALNQPVNLVIAKKVPSKNDLEMELNDTPLEKLPAGLKKHLGSFAGKKPGKFLRGRFRSVFDKWYEDVWLKERLNTK